MARRIHAYQQLEHSDCGQTCIRIICRYYGKKVSVAKIREVTDASKIGMAASDICTAFSKLGFESAVAPVDIASLSRMPLPAILYWNQSHFVVLHKIDSKGKFHIVDPARGKMKISSNEILEMYAQGGSYGIAILADPTEAFKMLTEDDPREKNGLICLAKSVIRNHSKSYMIVVLLTMFGIAADLVVPFVFQRTVDEGISSKDIHLIWLLVISQLIVFLGGYLSNSITNLVLSKLGLEISFNLLREYLNKLVALPMSFFSRKVGADLIQKVEDHHRIQAFLVSLPDTIVFSAINLLVFSGLLIYFSLDIFFIFLIGTILCFLWTYLFLQVRKEVDCSLTTYQAQNRNNLFELVSGIDEIKANNAHLVRVDVWNRVQNKANKLAFKSALIRFYQGGGNTIFTRIRDIVITGVCATMVVEESMTIGLMMTVSYIVGRLSVPFSTMISAVNSAQDASISFNRIDEIINWECPTPEASLTQKPSVIHFFNVRFKYPGSTSPYVINNFSATIPCGKMTAIVGESGCGKSTILKLLLGFHFANEGSILFDDTDISNVSSDSITSHIGIVMQNGKIFSGTILSNIALADDEPDLKRAEWAARVGCLSDFIQRLPMAYHTLVGESGIELSGGEKQRLLIARAVYRNPEILILDEATSALDAVTERRVVDNLYNAYVGKTLIVVAHRLSTVRHADNIIVLHNGKLAEQGTHKELLAQKGQYAELVKNQLEIPNSKADAY